jgi:hypothetical protein
MQAILTHYLPATAQRPPRIKATAFSGSLTVPVDGGMSVYEAHRNAAWLLIDRMGWRVSLLHGGTLYTGDMVWVFGDDD